MSIAKLFSIIMIAMLTGIVSAFAQTWSGSLTGIANPDGSQIGPSHPLSVNAISPAITPVPLDAYAVTVGGTAVNAVVGPANGCNFSSAVDLIVNSVGTAGTSASTTSQLLPAGMSYQCGPVTTNVSVNCSTGGTCSWAGNKW